MFVKYDEQVLFKDALAAPIGGRLRFKVASQAEPTQQVIGNSPVEGETQRLETPAAQPLEKVLRYSQFKFDI